MRITSAVMIEKLIPGDSKSLDVRVPVFDAESKTLGIKTCVEAYDNADGTMTVEVETTKAQSDAIKLDGRFAEVATDVKADAEPLDPEIVEAVK